MRLGIRNFRSIKEQELELAPITVVYGPNGAGKSSVLYALLTLKNIILNPNQNPSGFFNYVFTSLGGFESVVFDHNTRSTIELTLTVGDGERSCTYSVALGESGGVFRLERPGYDTFAEGLGHSFVPGIKLDLPVAFPYAANQSTHGPIFGRPIAWNGIAAQVSPGSGGSPDDFASDLQKLLNSPVETIRRLSIVPLRRGFSKPYYQSLPVSPLLVTEDEVASFLAANKYVVSKLSFYLEKMLQQEFRVNFQPGTGFFSLDATDKRTGVASELVNEGFGVNQLVYFLARSLHQDAELICVEEPEIHLHPTAIRSVGKALIEMVRNEGKKFIISTHSEALLSSLLAASAEGKLGHDELACYLARKDGRETAFERQAVDENGQIEGGLGSFIEGELEDLRAFLKPRK